ncbi:MAG: hypothetical protein H7X95_07740, partial [Deltaproteobacteria bacterium]|nr:hypothetical protein [Deltaproteobacteria bacterium]
MRNSLRLFGLLAVLAGVNVYVFFFNQGTAPREVLKPSSMVKAAEGKAQMLKQASDEANAALSPQGILPAATRSGAAANATAKAKPPVFLAPTPSGPSAKTGV